MTFTNGGTAAMFHSTLLFSIIIIISSSSSPAAAQPSISCSSDNGNYIANSTYRANLHHILSSLPTDNRLDQGFLNTSYGQSPDRVNAIALCRGDLNPELCRSCISDSVLDLPEQCPNQKEAVIWYPNCMFRYSDRRIVGVLRDTPAFWMWNIQDAVDLQGFSLVVQGLLADLAKEAASGDSKLKFAAGNVSTLNEDYLNVYGMMQCTPDISQAQCLDCLQVVAGVVQTWCPGKIGARIIRPNCFLRYEIVSFFNSTAVSRVSQSPRPPPTPPSPPSLSPNTTTNAAGSFLFAYFLVCLYQWLSLTFIYLCRKRVRELKDCHHNSCSNGCGSCICGINCQHLHVSKSKKTKG